MLKLTSAELLGGLANNVYLTAVDNAGTGTANMIKLDGSDRAVLPVTAQLATNAAPANDKGIPN